MAHTLNAVICDDDGIVHMIVVPDDDRQLEDAAFNPDGFVQLRVPTGGDPLATAQQLNPDLNLRLL